MSIVAAMNEAKKSINSKTDITPEVGIVLGTGLGKLADYINVDVTIPYSEISGFVNPTVEFHGGKLILGELGGKSVAALQGRFHYYEGYTMQEITFPVRVLNALGAEKLFISNAAGGLNPDFTKGDLVLISDYINLIGSNPLIGVNEAELGPRFTDMYEPYSPRMMEIAHEVGSKEGIDIKEGVYVAMSGPMLETKAEYKFLRMIGADMVGMSTVPETIVAVQMGMDVMGITIVSDMCTPETLEPVVIEEIIETCETAEPKLTTLIREMIPKV